MVMSVTLGENATFRVLANFSSENLKFQWLHNMTNISSEGMSSVLTVMNVMKKAGGNYSCIVFFPFGRNITSKEAQLFVCKEYYYNGITFFKINPIIKQFHQFLSADIHLIRL